MINEQQKYHTKQKYINLFTGQHPRKQHFSN